VSWDQHVKGTCGLRKTNAFAIRKKRPRTMVRNVLADRGQQTVTEVPVFTIELGVVRCSIFGSWRTWSAAKMIPRTDLSL
jgi:hypothetical protein